VDIAPRFLPLVRLFSALALGVREKPELAISVNGDRQKN
jgi:hypothetical protein